MLEEVRLSSLGVISEASLTLGPGLTVLTGETGAGKTMVLSALNLLMGGRGDSSLVRVGSGRAVVEGRWRLPADHPALLRAQQAGAEIDDDGTLLIHRSLSEDGRTRCSIGGAAVPVAVLAEIGADLVAVHGQADQQRLVQPAAQRDLIDRFAGEPGRLALEAYQSIYRELTAVRARLGDLTSRARERAVEAEGLRHGVERVGALNPIPGEEGELTLAANRLTHAEELAAAARDAHLALSGGDDDSDSGRGAHDLVATAARLVRGPAAEDPALAALADRLDACGYALSDVASDLARYAADVITDPTALAAVQDRIAALTALTRVYAPDAAGLVRWAADAAGRLAELDTDDDQRTELTANEQRLTAALATNAHQLRAVRGKATDRLVAETGTELASLAMPGAQLSAHFEATEPGPQGADHIALLLSAHAGAPARALGRSASGGELSRIMLALEVVLAGADPVPTLVFDEVDAGVGGAAAVEVGRRLARLATAHQVLVVTHLPQVAAFADVHVQVVKGAAGDVGTSDVCALEGSLRVRELSRMLAGLADSEAAHTHAEELLAAAAAARAEGTHSSVS